MDPPVVVRNPLGSLFFRPFTERFDPLHRLGCLGPRRRKPLRDCPKSLLPGFSHPTRRRKIGMRKTSTRGMAFGGVILLVAGCHSNTVDQGAFKSAINNYYSGKQECVWSAPVKFPAQADPSNDEQTKGFDALTDAGLLTRKTAEKSRFLIGSKQVNDYDVSDKGRSTWTAAHTKRGEGNFCL